ncbi:hypothetical protein A3K63_03165 [Candidatus Micrarchaeota archaeon RBG_16_49_10]|nr:MAG: hypothetical protein A3K63_03165 [Candidatus Micrarchaeota archaeon RBG_16_49_10]
MKIKNVLPLAAILLFILAVAKITYDNSAFFIELGQNILGYSGEKEEEIRMEKHVEPGYLSNSILVKMTPEGHKKAKDFKGPEDTGIASLDKLNKENKALKFEKAAELADEEHELSRWYLVTLDESEEVVKEGDPVTGEKAKKVKSVAEKYADDPNVEFAEPNYMEYLTAVPNDPYYSSDMWSMKRIRAEYAWNETVGSSDVVVAVIDGGINRTHPELKNNIWTNQDEVPGNGIDDDRNGFIDDYYGWDFANGDNEPLSGDFHGNHIAGTIAAEGNNNMGVVGVGWNLKIMSVKTFEGSGASLNRCMKGITYAVDNGAKVVSCSFISSTFSEYSRSTMRYAHSKGVVVVAAAGNEGLDALDYDPSGQDFTITVSGTDKNDLVPYWSNRGEKIDVGAPGIPITSICPFGPYSPTGFCDGGGTSFSAPHVAGVAALLFSKYPNLSPEEVRQLIRMGADDLGGSGKDTLFGYGRLNAEKTVSLAASNPHMLAPVIYSPQTHTAPYSQEYYNQHFPINISGANYQGQIKITGDSFANYRLEAGLGRSPTEWVLVATSNRQPATVTNVSIDTTKLPLGLNTFRLTAVDSNGKEYQFQTFDVNVVETPATTTTTSTTTIPCGNRVCSGRAAGEDCFTCPTDCACIGRRCSQGCCGDGVCNSKENTTKTNRCLLDCN